jgi:hypothetical protein
MGLWKFQENTGNFSGRHLKSHGITENIWKTLEIFLKDAGNCYGRHR